MSDGRVGNSPAGEGSVSNSPASDSPASDNRATSPTGGGAKLVKLIVGEIGRSSSRSRRPSSSAAASTSPDSAANAAAIQPPSTTAEWTFAWTGNEPRPVPDKPSKSAAQANGGDAAPDLTLSLTPDDAEAVRQGQLAPSVAFMQGRLKTSGDNDLLLQVLAWTASPGFQHALKDLAARG